MAEIQKDLIPDLHREFKVGDIIELIESDGLFILTKAIQKKSRSLIDKETNEPKTYYVFDFQSLNYPFTRYDSLSSITSSSNDSNFKFIREASKVELLWWKIKKR